MTAPPADEAMDEQTNAAAAVPIDAAAIARLTRLHAAEAVDALLAVMNDGDANAHARVAAAREMLHWSFRDEAGEKGRRGRDKDKLERIVRLNWAGKKLPVHENGGHGKTGSEKAGPEKMGPEKKAEAAKKGT